MNLHFNENNEEFMRLLMISTTLRGSYDEWIRKPNFVDVLNVNTNATCIELKRLYPDIDEKASQSIALAVLVYTYFIFFIVFDSNQSTTNSNILDDID
jgi:hypothetical protein